MTRSDQCLDDARLRALLDSKLPADLEAEATAHLDGCEACRERLERLADAGRLVVQLANQHLSTQLERSDLDAADAASMLSDPEKLKQLGSQETIAAQIRPDDQIDNLDVVDLVAGDAEESDSGDDLASSRALRLLRATDTAEALGRLGDYDVLEVLGEGGMGIVYRAHDRSLQREVALKLLAPALSVHETARKRFVREAQSASKVNHHNVVTVLGIGECESEQRFAAALPMLVMEYVDGETLEQLIDRRGTLSPPEIARIGLQIAAGLQAAHATNCIHRDIKPANILIESSSDRVVITDFGLARAGDDFSLTRTGVLAGTPTYMSPEQTHGRVIDQRSDLFSLGCVLYTACVGESPFEARTTLDVIDRVRKDNPASLEERRPDLPRPLAKLIHRLLEKSPERRPASALEVRRELKAFLKSITPGDEADRLAGLRSHALTVAGVCAALLVVSFAAWKLTLYVKAWRGVQAAASSGSLNDGPVSEETGAETATVRLIADGSADREFQSLQAAINAATDGDTLEFTAGVLPVEDTLEVENKRLSFQSAGGSAAVEIQRTPSDLSAPVFRIVDSQIDMRNIDMELSAGEPPASGRREDALMMSIGSEIHCGDCRFRRTDGGSLLRAAGGSVVTLERCRLCSPGGVAVQWEAGRDTVRASRLQVTDSLCHARVALESIIFRGNQAAELVVERTAFRGQHFWHCRRPRFPGAGMRSNRGDRAAGVRVKVVHSVFDLQGSVLSVDFPPALEPRHHAIFLSEAVFGEFRENVYSSECQFCSILAPSPHPPFPVSGLPTDLQQWKLRWADSDDSSVQAGIVMGASGEAGTDQEGQQVDLCEVQDVRLIRPDGLSFEAGPSSPQSVP